MRLLDRLFAATYDAVLAPSEEHGLGGQRAHLLAGLRGDVVELGAGTGHNLQYYPTDLASLTLLEPSPDMARRLRRHVTAERPDARVVEAAAESLPLEDDSTDVVVSTLVLCTVHDPRASLAEVRRVLRPGGVLVVLEHVAATGGVATVQRVINPAWRVVARGCNLDRDTRGLLIDAGFDASAVTDTTIPAPKLIRPAIAGVARPR